jgi:hypothetical protein
MIWRCTTALIQRDREREREGELIQVVIAGPSSAFSSLSFLLSHHITYHCITSYRITSRHITSHHIKSHHITVCINTFSHSLHLSPLSRFIIEPTHTRIHIAASGSAAVSSEGEIGDTPISELLSGDRNGGRNSDRERDVGER